ncbi:short-chain dehydrogenase/reductase family 16C member 6-like [Athalia rosae]|uniref:short-chain dehydrogenase/reductase family 16C member 6-like n=1 Tax=Athalia rosae TaxID=37344 RepID=UPI000626C73B|nr:short-chain dehydrogenase/reductase family 16C member 6-like [Athalia rosae]XP_048510678.1 short-chain dehydrogenase/reductase family 16C member 6-like [Athalia rosae]
MDLTDVGRLFYDTLVFVGMSIAYIAEAVILSIIPRRFRGKSIAGEVALVTGGGGGIGRLVAKKLALLGAHVVVWDINEPGIAETVRQIKEAGGKGWGYRCDLTNREDIYRTAKAVKIEVGAVTLLINNAGYVCGKTLLDLPDYEIDRTYQVNILSHYATTKAFLKDMMKENHGHIVTVASVAGLLGTYRCTDYSATKFAAIGYHESLFTELRAHGYDGIHATLVCPYFINTGMFDGVKPRLLPMLEPDFVAEEIVAGILTNQVNVVLPGSVRYLIPLKCFLPAKMCWALMYQIMQGPQSMMMFRGRDNQILQDQNANITNLKVH